MTHKTVIADGVSMRPVRLTVPASACRRLGVGSVVLEPARISALSVRGGATPKPSQTVVLAGELDAATAVLARRQLRGAAQAGRGALVLDCSAVQFIDAAWLGVLVSTARYGALLGRKVVVAAPSPRVLRALRLVGLDWLAGKHAV